MSDVVEKIEKNVLSGIVIDYLIAIGVIVVPEPEPEGQVEEEGQIE
jgi:hypothetical protein